MQIFANKLNGTYLRDVLPDSGIEIDSVKAAIAYGSDTKTLIRNCLHNKYRLDIWMRYDHTVPVSPDLLEHLLANINNNIFCKLVPDVLHSKVIWWKNYGVYIGSANLTDRAWLTNIELGIFITDSELESSGALSEIESFFDQFDNYEEIRPLTSEIIREQREFQKDAAKRYESEAHLRKRRAIPKWDGPVTVADREFTYSRGLQTFLREWNTGLTFLRHLAELVPNYRPQWLHADVPAAWQADQFLHAYYYNRVKQGVRYPVEEFYHRHHANPAAAVTDSLGWWSQLDQPPSQEDENCHRWAPLIRRLLSRQNLVAFTEEQLGEICFANHSTMDHVRRTNLGGLGIAIPEDSSPEERARAFAAWIWARRNLRGERVDAVIQYVLDGGSVAETPNRLYEAARTLERKIPHFNINQLAELAGWARPEHHPPRNGRTSKSLRALGYDVRVY